MTVVRSGIGGFRHSDSIERGKHVTEADEGKQKESKSKFARKDVQEAAMCDGNMYISRTPDRRSPTSSERACNLALPPYIYSASRVVTYQRPVGLVWARRPRSQRSSSGGLLGDLPPVSRRHAMHCRHANGGLRHRTGRRRTLSSMHAGAARGRYRSTLWKRHKRYNSSEHRQHRATQMEHSQSVLPTQTVETN